jgi:plastocyanin
MGDFIPRTGMRWGRAGLGIVLVLSACSSTGKDKGAEGQDTKGKEANSAAVAIVNFAFAPKDVQVPVGTKVIWTNQDDTAHNIQDLSELNTPISPDLKNGDQFSITYPKPGSYPYVCGLHNYMTGTVKVT